MGRGHSQRCLSRSNSFPLPPRVRTGGRTVLGSHLLRVRPAFGLIVEGSGWDPSPEWHFPWASLPPDIPVLHSSCSERLSSACHVPGTILNPGDTAESSTGKAPARSGLRF